jgi:hypothetical protein
MNGQNLHVAKAMEFFQQLFVDAIKSVQNHNDVAGPCMQHVKHAMDKFGQQTCNSPRAMQQT